MRYSILTLILLGLAACGNEAPAPAEQDAADDTAEQQTAPQPQADTGTKTDDEETIQVVEESAAEEPAADDEEPLMLAQAAEPAASKEWKYKEGTHYARLVPSQPTWGGADKIEVAEFFWYGCPHCFDFEPYLNRWKAQKDPNVRFVKVPAVWNPLVEMHARMFFVEEILGRNGNIKDPDAFRSMVFEEYHRRGNRMTSENAIFKLFERVGVSREDFDATWKSFEVDQNLRKARDLARRYNVASVPTIVVNGKYRTGGQEAGSYVNLIEIIDELTEREALR